MKYPCCGSSELSEFKIYETMHNGRRHWYICKGCSSCFSETFNTAMQDIKSPISKVASLETQG